MYGRIYGLKKVTANVQLMKTSTLNIKHNTWKPSERSYTKVHMPKAALQANLFCWRKPKPHRFISALKYKHPETKVIGDTKRHSGQQETHVPGLSSHNPIL